MAKVIFTGVRAVILYLGQTRRVSTARVRHSPAGYLAAAAMIDIPAPISSCRREWQGLWF
jgi:hypothetical protein